MSAPSADETVSVDAAPLPHGAATADWLARRYPDRDWIAALAKGVVVPRAEIVRRLESSDPLPADIVGAVRDIERLLTPADPSSTESIFAAQTNASDAPIEVDAEAGMTVQPGAKMEPSRTGSRHEMGERTGSLDPDQQ